ncbi:MAG TPA: peptidylprolyl isomerase [Saprospiraceae bacterium]|nr:peptidylprolyl isomerase [Saprospiraceae bacterium]HRK81587.1 peptidylprolyl isomerase [Saprospiraceae bacterium]
MKYILFIISAFILASCGDGNRYALIETEYGNMKVMLYNTTPKHRDNFVKLAKEGYYDDLLFHRIIPNFMIQGGDPDSRNAAPGAMLGMGGPGYQIDAEIGSPHLKGALAAARDQNPEKRSSGSQFYIVQGQRVDDNVLNGLEQQKGIRYSPEQRQLYREIGGAPFLDGDYTVFGEVVEGLDVLDKIAAVPTAPGDRPLQDVKMKVKLVRK